MRKRIRNSEEEVKESINVSPLIDVVFILLIFFIVSATFVSLPGVEISRPRTETAESWRKTPFCSPFRVRTKFFMPERRSNYARSPA